MNNGETKQSKQTARIEAFSDGVFAIAITLLIIELVQILHPQESEKIIPLILHHWEALFAFAIGFMTLMICWINHHLIFDYIVRSDSRLMWVNAMVLLVVTFTPFPTAIVAGYFETEPNYSMALFGFNYLLMATAAWGLAAYVNKHNLIETESEDTVRKYERMYLLSIGYNTIALVVCFFSVIAAIAMYLILFVVFAFPKESTRRLFGK